MLLLFTYDLELVGALKFDCSWHFPPRSTDKSKEMLWEIQLSKKTTLATLVPKSRKNSGKNNSHTFCVSWDFHIIEYG